MKIRFSKQKFALPSLRVAVYTHLLCTHLASLAGTIKYNIVYILTERDGHQADERYEQDGGEEMRELGVQTHDVVHDRGEQHRYDQEYRHLGERLAQEVHVRPVHPVVVLPHEYRKFGTEHLQFSK